MAAKKAGKSVRARKPASELPVLEVRGAAAWQRWLEQNHASARGVWLTLAKKGTGKVSFTYADAVEAALCWGWIDGQGRALDDARWLVKFTPRGARSVWSKINRARATAQIERAQRDGRWEAAYDSPRAAAVPPDLEAALAARPRAQRFFAELDAANRYAILWRLQTAKRPETRARRLAQFTDMLERGERIHPASRAKPT